ncbi:hypothetical protein AMQ84_05940 [Paenibacillus riograndensis]|uniref:Uncharacterized protein n=1 Tax=Paenibacillus riograndensis TaxID=483937 RepID=A0A132U827_9BACL|nr:hypothetical protein AMQ84_05940 [Paenibacillus riograndensis]
MIPPTASFSLETERTSPRETVINIIPDILIMTGTTVMTATTITATAGAAGAADMAVTAAGTADMAVTAAGTAEAIAEATTAGASAGAIPAAAAEMAVVVVAETEPHGLKNPLAECRQRVLFRQKIHIF